MGDSDKELLRRFANDQDEAAFEQLMRRHVDLVHSAALRQAGLDPQAAQDIAQTVFIDLARKAWQLCEHASLTGWLYTAVRHAAAAHGRTEARRTQREQTALFMNPAEFNLGPEPDWSRLRPLLDAAMYELSSTDREAILLRCFERRAYAEIGVRLGVGENAARMRVDRAMERLGGLLARRGVNSTAAGLALVLETHAVTTTPPSVAEGILRCTRGALRPSGIPSVTSPLVRLGWSWTLAILLMVGIGGQMWTNRQTGSSAVRSDSAPGTAESSDRRHSVRSDITADGTQAGGAPSRDTEDGVADRLNIVDGSILHLLFVAQDTGYPVPNVTVTYRGSERSHFTQSQYTASPNGEVWIRILPETSYLELTSISEGFADTRLTWHPDKGDKIPERRQVRLERAVLIGGRILDPAGNPVPGATVSLSHWVRGGLRPTEEGDEFMSIETTADQTGAWKSQRIAASTLPFIQGLAFHPDFQPSNVEGYQGQLGLDHRALEQELKTQRHVFRLRGASIVEGEVVDESGAPIAEARVRVGHKDFTGSRETRTDLDGRFLIRGGPTGTTSVTAEAQGFGANTLSMDIKDRNEPIRIVLAKAIPLRIRVVDTNGMPVPKAYVLLVNIAPVPNPPVEGKSLLQASFEGRTDAEGRTVWEDAAAGTHEFDVWATGFTRKSRAQVPADDKEHDIVLDPALLLQGTVTEASTGKLVPRFRCLFGLPQYDSFTGKTNIQVIDMNQDSLTFFGGTFHHALGEQIQTGVANPMLMVRFEADGYQPFTSRAIRYDEGVVTLNVALERSENLEMTVVDAEGRPVPGASVGLVTPGSMIILGPAGLAQTGNQGLGLILQADAQGRVKLQKDPVVERIIVAGNAGFAETTWARLQSDAVLPLAPWGWIRGRVLGTAGTLEGKILALSLLEGIGAGFQLDFTARADAEGRFQFTQVPAGSIWVEERLIETSGNTKYSLMSRSKEVTVTSGSTVEVSLGGGTQVSGQLVLPAGFQLQPDGVWVVQLRNLPTAIPSAEVRADPAALVRWYRSPEALRRQRQQRHLPASVDNEGRFVVDAVEAGTYLLHVRRIRNASEKLLQFPATPPLLELAAPVQVTVSEDPTRIDLGEIRLQAPSGPPGN